MRQKAATWLAAYRKDFSIKTLTVATISAGIGIAMILYSGCLGVFYHSVWHGAICVYYMLLAVVRTLVILAHRRSRDPMHAKTPRRMMCAAQLLLLGINLALIGPIVIMIHGQRSEVYGMIPAIAMAAYTTYRMTMAVVNFKRSRRATDPKIKTLRDIHLMDALVAVLLLQNTLILAVEGKIAGEMRQLSIYSSAGIWLLIALISIRSLWRSRRETLHATDTL